MEIPPCWKNLHLPRRISYGKSPEGVQFQNTPRHYYLRQKPRFSLALAPVRLKRFVFAEEGPLSLQ